MSKVSSLPVGRGSAIATVLERFLPARTLSYNRPGVTRLFPGANGVPARPVGEPDLSEPSGPGQGGRPASLAAPGGPLYSAGLSLVCPLAGDRRRCRRCGAGCLPRGRRRYREIPAAPPRRRRAIGPATDRERGLACP